MTPREWWYSVEDRARQAERLGVPLSTLKNVCLGYQKPGIRLALKLSRELGFPLSTVRPDLWN